MSKPNHMIFFTRALLTAKSLELVVETSVHTSTMLVAKYNKIAAELYTKEIGFTLDARTEPTDDGKMRLRATVTRRRDEWAAKISNIFKNEKHLWSLASRYLLVVALNAIYFVLNAIICEQFSW